MKKNYWLLILTTSFCAACNFSFAQNKVVPESISFDLSLNHRYPNLLPVPIPESPKNFRANNISMAAIRDFRKRYKGVENETWTKWKNNYDVRFIVDSVDTRVWYTLNGSWAYSIKKYSEKNLPKDIRGLVKSRYYDFTILLVFEWLKSTADGPVYYVHMKDDTTYKIIKVSSEEMVEYESFTMQKLKP
jgi:hypothetical protein